MLVSDSVVGVVPLWCRYVEFCLCEFEGTGTLGRKQEAEITHGWEICLSNNWSYICAWENSLVLKLWQFIILTDTPEIEMVTSRGKSINYFNMNQRVNSYHCNRLSSSLDWSQSETCNTHCPVGYENISTWPTKMFLFLVRKETLGLKTWVLPDVLFYYYVFIGCWVCKTWIVTEDVKVGCHVSCDSPF